MRSEVALHDLGGKVQQTTHTSTDFFFPLAMDQFRTDVWALGCCLYSLAFLQNCFEEGSNLAILSGKYTIPEDNPYGDGLEELLDRMLTADSKARADMTEVILCLSAVYSGRPLPPRKRSSRASKSENQEGEGDGNGEGTKEDKNRIGTYRTDGQGIQQPVYDPTKATEGKKLASNSVAARRKRAAAAHVPSSATTGAPAPAAATPAAASADPLDFSSFGGEGKDESDAFGSDVAFGEMKGAYCIATSILYQLQLGDELNYNLSSVCARFRHEGRGK